MFYKLFFIFFILLSCHTNKKQGIGISSKTSHYDEFFSRNIVKKTIIAIDRDSIFFLLQTDFENYPIHHYENYWFDSNYNYNKSDKVFEKKSFDSSIMIKTNLINKPLFIEEIAKLEFKYDKLPSDIFKLLKKKGIQIEDTMIKKYDNTYFIADNSCITKYPQIITFNATTDKLDTIHFDMTCSVLRIKSFFLYDLKNDGMPEAFVITTSNIPKDQELIFWGFMKHKEDGNVSK